MSSSEINPNPIPHDDISIDFADTHADTYADTHADKHVDTHDTGVSEQGVKSFCENRVIEVNTRLRLPKKIPHTFMLMAMGVLVSFSFLVSSLKSVYFNDVNESDSLPRFQYYNLSMVNDTIKTYFIQN